MVPGGTGRNLAWIEEWLDIGAGVDELDVTILADAQTSVASSSGSIRMRPTMSSPAWSPTDTPRSHRPPSTATAESPFADPDRRLLLGRVPTFLREQNYLVDFINE